MFRGTTAVLYRELKVFRRRLRRQLLAASVSPVLFLIAFGWGFGRETEVNGLPYITFLIPGLITMSSLNQSYGIAQELNIARFFYHIFDEYLIAPVSHVEIVLGEAIYGMIKGLLSTIIIFLLALLFRVQLLLSPLFLVAIGLHTFIFATLGITMAMIVRDHTSQASVNTFVITPMIFLCGTFFPVDKLPPVFNGLVHLLPLTYSTKVIRAALTGGEVSLLYLALMALFAMLFLGTALWAVKRVEA